MELPLPLPEKLPRGVRFPTWVVLDVQGRYPARSPRQPLQQALQRTESLEAFDRRIDALSRADWLHGVLVRIGDLKVDVATAWHLARSLRRLSKEKRTVGYANALDMASLLVASGTREIAAPGAAEFNVTGFSMEVTFLAEFLKRHGIGFENAAIREYKTALAPLTQDRMDPHDREQRETLLESVDAAWVRDVAEGRGVDEATVRGWLSEGITSAARAREVGMIDRVAYEDELVGPAMRHASTVGPVLRTPRSKPGSGRVAVVQVVGAIVTGRSKNNPLPLVGGVQAGSDSVVAALRRAQRDPHTKAIVLYVNSGGGSALASDLIWREVARSKKPVVAVMGELAASGGYYVLTHARRVIAAPTTITGSIGVFSAKPVLEEFNARQGLRPERVSRSEFPGLQRSSTRWSPQERSLIDRSIAEVYERFTSRVAEGRGLTPERVDELGRGRIWSGADALKHGLVDELGDLNTGIQRACELAGLPYGAPTWTVEPQRRWELPDLAQPVVDAAQVAFPVEFTRERAMVWLDGSWRLTSR